jgi:uncharacterized protein
MGADWLTNVEPLVHESRIKVPYSWSVGDIGSRFLTEIRDHQRILGKKCEGCGTVFVPPRKMCHRCFQDTGPWVEVGPAGTVTSYTVVRYDNGLQPVKPPFAYGIIRLDGSSTGLVHLLGEMDLKTIQEGLRVEPVFKEQRTGQILDIAYFRPAKG